MKKYTGSCYLGVVGPETGFVDCWMSIMNIERRPGDSIPTFVQGTKGYEGRQAHFNRFIESEHDVMFLLDHDMIFRADTLERLRSWEMPFVSGFYMRRRHSPIAPVWYDPYTGEWPLMPYYDLPPKDKLVPIGASGWGCMLIHREVVEKTREYLGGEWDVIEDDCDVWADTGEPLRPNKDPIGSDIRYPLYALRAGYQLMGDGGVMVGHMFNFPLSIENFEQLPEEQRQQWKDKIVSDVLDIREQLKGGGS